MQNFSRNKSRDRQRRNFNRSYSSDRSRSRERSPQEVTYIPNREETCLTKDQAKQIYREIEKNELINIQIVNQGIKDGNKVRNRQVEEEDVDIDVNPYQKVISNASPKDENKTEQMINWSIFSNKVRYVDSSMNMMPRLTIRPLEETTTTTIPKELRYPGKIEIRQRFLYCNIRKL